MHDLLPFMVIGLVTGSVYGLIATGLVLTFKTSGIFNFAQGAFATLGAYGFYVLHTERGIPWPVAGLLVLLIVGLATGWAMEQFGRRLARRPQTSSIVGTVGIILVVEGVLTAEFPGNGTESVHPFLPRGTFKVAGVYVGYDQVIIIALGAVAVLVLSMFLRRTRAGMNMRAVVDDPALVAAQGTNPTTVRRFAWVISSGLACLSGMLLVPSIGLNPTTLTLLVVPGFAAAAVGAFNSLTLTYLGGLVVGIGQALLSHQFPGQGILGGLSPSFPFIVLVVVLAAVPSRRLILRREPPPAVLRTWRAPPRVLVGFAALVVTVLIFVPALVGTQLLLYTGSLATAIVLLSLGLLVREAGLVSLAQVAFMAIGAAAFAHFSSEFGVPWFGSLICAVLVTAPAGAVIALLAVRLSGIYLALATLGFGILVEQMFYLTNVMFTQYVEGVAARRPGTSFLHGDRGFYYLTLGITVCVCVAVVVLTRTRLGRLLRGLGGSPLAMSTLGTSVTALKATVFTLSAMLAGLGGALYASTTQAVTGAEFPSFQSLVFFALISIMVVEAPWYGLFAAVGGVIIPSFFHQSSAPLWFNVVFGVGAISSGMTSTPVAPARVRRIVDWLGGRGTNDVSYVPGREKTVISGDQVISTARMGSRRALKGGVPALEVRHVSVHYGGTVAVRDFSLSVPQGQITGLIGPNGAGKTTTFNACCGLVDIASGQIEIDGEDVSRRPPAERARRGLGRSFQHVELMEALTVEENVRLGAEASLAGRFPLSQLAARPGERSSVSSRAEEAADLVGIRQYWRRTVSELATGQRRLVELARCLAGPFHILLLDEPSSGLDPDETIAFGQVLQKVIRQRDSAILLVEHDMSLVLTICDYIYVMNFGEHLFEGSPTEVRSSSAVQSAYLGGDVGLELGESVQREHGVGRDVGH